MRLLATPLLLCMAALAYCGPALSATRCSEQARALAKKLLIHHLDDPELTREPQQITIDSPLRLPNAKNPADPKQRLIVLEVWGYVEKGQFRMRFSFMSHTSASCIPVGQEIVNWASF